MNFYMPVTVYDEENCVINHAHDIAQLGTNALIVTGKHSSKKNGSLSDAINALDLHNVSYHIFDEIEENPSIETIMKARNIFATENIDFVIGIGGGSCIDAAKAIALMLANLDKAEDFLDKKTPKATCLDVVAIPTTCGTGSEVTGVSVLTRHSKRTKGSIAHKIYPTLALIDSKYLQSAQTSLIVNTSVDALAHLIESYINSNACAYSKMFVHEGLRTWKASKNALLNLVKEAPNDCSDILFDDDYRNLMRASTFAGMAIAHTGTAIPHGLSYPVTYELKIPHGKACAYFLAGYLKEAPEDVQKTLLNLVEFNNVEQFRDFLINICNLQAISENIVNNSINMLVSNESKLKNCPYNIDESVLRKIADFTLGQL